MILLVNVWQLILLNLLLKSSLIKICTYHSSSILKNPIVFKFNLPYFSWMLIIKFIQRTIIMFKKFVAFMSNQRCLTIQISSIICIISGLLENSFELLLSFKVIFENLSSFFRSYSFFGIFIFTLGKIIELRRRLLINLLS